VAPLVATRRGYFRDEGLTDWDLGATGEDEYAIEGIKAGRIHVALDIKPELVLRENNKGADVFIIGAFINGLAFVLIGAKGIMSIQDLKGKRIPEIERGGSIASRQLKALLRQHGLDPNRDVEFVRQPSVMSYPEEWLHTLDSGEYGARTTKKNNLEKALEKGYPLLADFAEIYPEGYLQRAMVTTGTMINQNPETIKAVLKGIIRGYRYMRKPENFDELVRMCKEVVWEKAFGWDSFDESLWETDFRVQFTLVPRDGMITKKGLETYMAEEKLAGKLPEACTMDQFVRLQFVEKASRELDDRFGSEGYE
jgi:ABC-type nitrate/sulfonate/bicarbonate transport system substrate-binding protein